MEPARTLEEVSTERRNHPSAPGAKPVALRGRKLGDRRVRVDRPNAPFFRYADEGQLVAREAASEPRTPAGRALAKVRAVLFGRPLSIHEEIGERLSKVKALAIFCSDAISSSAYATEEILRVLVLAGAAALFASIEVSIAIALLLAVVALSYRQVCKAFPNGGGAYAVARSELTPLLGLVAAAALLIDYVMTVAVSTSSALDQLASLVPAAGDYKVLIAAGVITLITIANLRGLRESGNIFAVPTYVFVVLALGIVALGLVQHRDRQCPPAPGAAQRRVVRARTARRSCSSSRRSPAGPSRSPASRRSRTGCRRSSRRRLETPRTR